MPRRRRFDFRVATWWRAPLLQKLEEMRFDHPKKQRAFEVFLRDNEDNLSRLASYALASEVERELDPGIPPLRFRYPTLPTVEMQLRGRVENRRPPPFERPLDALPREARNQVLAFAHLIAVAFIASRSPTRIDVGGPRGLDHPGDVVGIDRLRGVAGSERDRHRRKGSGGWPLIHAKGVAGKLLGQTMRCYGSPRPMIARTLTNIVTETTLTLAQIEALIRDEL